MITRNNFVLFNCFAAATLLMLAGCSDSSDPAATDVGSTSESAAVAPDVPQADADSNESPATAERDAKRPEAPSKDAFLAAADKGINVGGVGSDKNETPPFVSTPDNPGPTEPVFSDPAEAPAGIDAQWRQKWETSFEKAKAVAQAEKKDILMNFTGSDWCGWCIRLGNEVFQHKAFTDYAAKNFVLLELDFPRGFELEESLQQQNDALQAQFSVEGFPAILLADGLGRAYAQTGYQPGGPDGYIEHLEMLKGFRATRDAAFNAAEALTGAEKAKKLDEALETIQPSLRFASYPETVDQIIELDSDGTAGLKEKYEMGRAERAFSQRMQQILTEANATGDWDKVLADLDKLITDYAAFDELALQAQMLQLQVLRIAERPDDLIKLADTLLKDEGLAGQARLQVYVNKLTVLDSADRLDEALPVVDAILTDFADQEELRVNLLMTKASFLARLGQKDAAKAAIQTVRENADPSLLPQIDDFEKEILAESEPEDPKSAAEQPAANATK
ncbi:MAG: thioredoxin family protein [Planctomycetota bacterium]|jgi:thioredoxin-related protein